MPDDADLTQQLRLLGDLRDLLERWLDLAKPEQRDVGQVQALLLDIQRARNELLEVSMTTARVVVERHLQSSRTLLGASLDLLRVIAGPFSPLQNITQEFLRRADLLRGPHGSGGGSED